MSDDLLDMGFWGHCWGASTITGDAILRSADYPDVKLLVLQIEPHLTSEQVDLLAQRIHDRFDGTGALVTPDGGGGGSRMPGRKAA